uniref:NEW3 domain-containing protein n=1 Tax=Geminisphaera colitermitum TaxID=1148786 RepID=UPI0005BA6B23
HHRVRDQLAPLLGVNIAPVGASLAKPASLTQLSINSGHAKQTLLADTSVTASATTARVLATGLSEKNRRPVAYLNTLPPPPPSTTGAAAPNLDVGRSTLDVGRSGRRPAVLYFPFELGTLILQKPAEAMSAFLLDGPTADREEYALQQGELAISRWLGDRLREAGLTPAVAADKKLADTGNLRVEQPFIDKSGNLALVITTRADSQQRPLPPGTITLPLPGGPWETAWWAPAEDDSLTAIPVRATTDGRYKVTLPAIPSAGVLYLFGNQNHAPVLSIPAIASTARAADGHTAKLPPGVPFPLTIELINTTPAPLPPGNLRAQALADWQISPAATTDTPELAPGRSHKVTFTITPPADVALVKPDWLYPLVANWSPAHSNTPSAIITANVVMDIPAKDALLVLTDNAHYPATYPYLQHTGATYRYSTPTPGTPAAAAISDPAQRDKNVSPGTALTNGFNNKTGQRNASGPYSASYATKNITVDFDLKAPRSVRRVVVNAGPGEMLPMRLAVSTSDNGETFTPQLTQLPPTGGASAAVREYTITLPAAVSARHVRLAVEWPLAGGTLGEVEIWGN